MFKVWLITTTYSRVNRLSESYWFLLTPLAAVLELDDSCPWLQFDSIEHGIWNWLQALLLHIDEILSEVINPLILIILQVNPRHHLYRLQMLHTALIFRGKDLVVLEFSFIVVVPRVIVLCVSYCLLVVDLQQLCQVWVVFHLSLFGIICLVDSVSAPWVLFA